MPYYIRHLSAGETISDMIHAYGADVVLHAAMVQSKVPITRRLLERAISILLQQQPALRACITSEKGPHGKGSHFLLTECPLDVEVIDADSRKAWVAIAEVELSRPFNSLMGPLWKLKFVRFGDDTDSPRVDPTDSGHTNKGALLLTMHQALVDGIVMFDLLYRQLLRILNDLIDNTNLSSLHTPLALLPPAEVAFSDKPLNPSKNSFKEPTVLKHLTEKHQPLFRPLWSCVGNGPPHGASVSRLLPFMMPAEASRLLIEKCYENQSSPKAVLITAAAMALSITAAKYNIHIGDNLLICLPIDLRHYQHMPKPQPLGNWLAHEFITVVKQRNHIDFTLFWRDAFKVHQNLVQQREGWLNLSTPKTYFDQHRAVMNKILKEQTVGPTSKLNRAHFTLYDLGNCDLMTSDSPPVDHRFERQGPRLTPDHSANSDGSVRMSEHYFVASMSDVTTIPLALTVCTYRGRLMWTLTYNQRWITKSFATRFINRMLETLKGLTAVPQEEEIMDFPSSNNWEGRQQPVPTPAHVPFPVPLSSPYSQQQPMQPREVPVNNYPYPRQQLHNPETSQNNYPYPSQQPVHNPTSQSNYPYPRQQPSPEPFPDYGPNTQPIVNNVPPAPPPPPLPMVNNQARTPQSRQPAQPARSSPSSSMSRPSRQEEISRLPPVIRMQRMAINN